MEQHQHLFQLWKNGNKKQVFNSIASMTGLEAGLVSSYIHDQELKNSENPCFIKDLETMYLATKIMNSDNTTIENPVATLIKKEDIIVSEKNTKVKPIQKSISVNNCMECPHHEVISDGDPHDSFCSDDKAVVCQLVKNKERNINSLYHSDRSEFKAITRSARPYNLRKECNVPEWCPMPTLIIKE